MLQPRFRAPRTAARITAFKPGASPPPVEMATRMSNRPLSAADTLHELQNLTLVGVPAQLLLGKHEPAVDRNLEQSPGCLDQAHLGIWILLANLGRQTGGPGLVVSDDAILYRHLHEATFRWFPL